MLSVNDLMNSEPRTVRPDDSLSLAAKALWDGNCGGLPVVDEERHPVGFLTDRDIAMSGAMQGRPLHELSVSSSMSGRCVTVSAAAGAARMHELMREHKVRRLPVVDGGGVLVGMVSVSDLVSHVAAQPRATKQAGELRRTLGELSHATRSVQPPAPKTVKKVVRKAVTSAKAPVVVAAPKTVKKKSATRGQAAAPSKAGTRRTVKRRTARA